ncbi:MAG: radical SAM protein [Saprospiraceae bacterium]
MRKKIVLYNPIAVFFDMPLALLAIASQLDATKYEVIIIDARVDNQAHKKVLEACEGALCFGVTVLTGRPILDALQMSQQVKATFKDLPIVWGGWHPSLFPTEILAEEKVVDICVDGQGEETFKELIEHFEGNKDLKSINGIAYRDAQNIIHKNLKRHLKDLNELKSVNYELIEVEKYFHKKKNRQLDYISSAGCRFRCTFCADPFVYNRGWSGVLPQRMGEEFAYWQKKYQFTDINFQDETFFTKRKRVNEFAEALLQRNIKTTWAGTLRGDQGNRMSEEEFDLVKKSGLRRVLVGVESGSQEMMDWLKKDIKMEHIYTTAERCAKRNIAVIFPFIVGFPEESDASVVASLQMAKELNQMHTGFTTPIFYFKPYPGSKITEDVVAKGYQLPHSLMEWADFDYVGSAGPWVSKEKYRLIERFKFYNKVAGRKHHLLTTPLKWIAKWRMEMEFYGFPMEKILADNLMPQKQLS